jgi:hypothetical protein
VEQNLVLENLLLGKVEQNETELENPLFKKVEQNLDEHNYLLLHFFKKWNNSWAIAFCSTQPLEKVEPK